MSTWPLSSWSTSGSLLMGEVASTSEPKEQELAARALSQLSASYRPYVASMPPKKNVRAPAPRMNPYPLVFPNPQMTGDNMQPVTLAQQVMNTGVPQQQQQQQQQGGGGRRKEKGGDYHCPVDMCGKSFHTSEKLQSHMAMHSADRPHECTFCHRRFRRVDHLKKHERIHTGEKPFACEICGRAFARSDKLYTHKKAHLSEQSGHTQVPLPSMSNSLVFVQPVSPRD
ncbi:unnamed protein product, partial [Mesorhabditis belari]|uniref:C2H2-type domain-containing protein n=1 Tax=Mesorhabditis belari TaxID=2138241 RepID=A0AAF3E8P3_9BILA